MGKGCGNRARLLSFVIRDARRQGPASRHRFDNAPSCFEVAKLTQIIAVRLDPCRRALLGVARKAGEG